jgi:hypothetical protein
MNRDGLEVAHELVQAFLMLSFTETGQVRVEGGHGRTLVAQIDLDLAEVLALLKEMRGVRVAQCVWMGGFLNTAGSERQAESPLHSGAAEGFAGRGCALTAVAFSREEQGRMAMGFPLLAQQLQGALGKGHVTVAIAFASPNVEEHAPGIDVAYLEPEPFSQTQSAGVDGGQADALTQALHLAEDLADFRSGKNDRQFELGIGADQIQFLRPVALEGFFPKELEGADELSGGLTGDLLDGLEVNAVLADLFNGDQFGRPVVLFTELAETGVVSLFGARADGQKLQVIGEGF